MHAAAESGSSSSSEYYFSFSDGKLETQALDFFIISPKLEVFFSFCVGFYASELLVAVNVAHSAIGFSHLTSPAEL